MNSKQIFREKMKWWLVKFILICAALFIALSMCFAKVHHTECEPSYSNEYYFEDGILEAEYVTARDAITANSIFAVNAAFDNICVGDDDQSLNILDIELKDNKLTIYKVHGDPIIINLDQ